ncbi:ligand-binding sensor domain-containing diguanylate cyclase [Acidipila sp. EB88]|uniref:ligand-binding sensor domain-containing diguanylate cyclase n=1 Tax=Acidipila sp. EB88 TaxID=2305226 RepID=UPI000F5EBA28|nr:ligand-binding sensor domain-containing diguanylate cyclase [Acidipila sp. EB88]RRA47351.1 GGDEF domain-containing protein [Acidipila sp. EB88]
MVRRGLRHWLSGCLLVLLLAGSACAHAQHFSTTSYGASDGLSNLTVDDFLDDRSGLVWVGTQNGVFTANAQHFDRSPAFAQAGMKFVRLLRQDTAGRIWAMDSRQLAYLDHPEAPGGGAAHVIPGLDLHLVTMEGIDLRFVRGEPDTAYLLREGTLLRLHSDDQGARWQIAPAFAPAMIRQHPELGTLTSVFPAVDDALWAGCGQSLCRVDLAALAHVEAAGRTGAAGGDAVRVYGPQQGVPHEAWLRLLVGRSGTLWARGQRTVISLDKGAAHFRSMDTLPSSLFLYAMGAVMAEDPQGRILLNLNQGVARSEANHWHLFAEKNGLPDGAVNALMFDRTGQLWLAPAGHGITIWPGYGQWEGWTREEGLGSSVVWASPRDATGKVWVITQAGLDRLDPATSKIVPRANGLQRLTTGIMDTADHLWLGDGQGNVLELDPLTGHTHVAAAGLGRIFTLLRDRQDRIWIAAESGVSFLSAGDRLLHRVGPEQIPAGYAWSMTQGQDGTIWVANAHGLYRLRGEQWSHIELPFAGGSAYDFMLAAAADGTLWVQGKLPYPVLHLAVQGNKASILESIGTSIIPSDSITFLETDRRGWIWVGSDAGVSVFNGQRWVHCTADDGLLWDDTDDRAFLADPDGSVWIGTSAGLSHLLHPKRLFSTGAPDLQLDGAELSAQRNGNAPITQVDGGSFDLRKPTLNVYLRSTSYSRGSALVYKYRMDGQENTWQESRTPLLRFPSLPAGTYRLTMLAYDERLHLSSAPLSLGFEVLPPWWLRTWAWLLWGTLAALLLWLLWRASVRLLVVRQHDLEVQVAQRTAELELEKTELLNTRSALIEMTRKDGLTGLLNRAAIFERMRTQCELACKTGTPMAFAMADLDSFKRINDAHGHVVGDTVLRECAARIARAVRTGDSVGRYGGEELLILMPGLHPDAAEARMEALRLAVAGEPVMHDDLGIPVTASFGVAWLGVDFCTVESLVSLADSALYLAKQRGRNRVEFVRQHNSAWKPQQEALPPVKIGADKARVSS